MPGQYDGFTGEKHPEIYQNLPPKGNKPHQLTSEQIQEYLEKGYLLIEDFFTDDELKKVEKDLNDMVERLAQKLLAAGKIKNVYSDLGFHDRLVAIDKEFPGSNVLLIKAEGISEGMKSLACNHRLLNLLEDLLGPSISFNPIWNMRCKTPNNEVTTVPWHQDSGYFDSEAYKLQIITTWIPLVDTTLENGTLQFVSGAHKDALVARHTCCVGNTWYVAIDDEELQNRFGIDVSKDSQVLEVKRGSFLLFNNFTPHRSLNNVSQEVRWSLDFRYQASGTPAGYYGLKVPCELRKDGEDVKEPDWETYNSVDRSKCPDVDMRGALASGPFSTIMSGPWMRRWEVVHHNKHTENFVARGGKWDPSLPVG